MDENGFQILIVGLGLIGGSLAKALNGFENAVIYGVDSNPYVIKQAVSDGVIAKGFTDAQEILPFCDLVYVCLYPYDTVQFINSGNFKKGALVTDVSGVKQWIYERITNRDIDYIGGHPMAGKEVGGYANSFPCLFHNASYIITPTAKNRPENVTLLKQIIFHLGCRKALVTTPREHDEMISYTSQLMHVMAAALCDNELLGKAEGFSAGSLRDCTRVANLNEKMWSELFLANKKELIKRITEFENSLDMVKTALEQDDKQALEKFLHNAAARKRRYLNEITNG